MTPALDYTKTALQLLAAEGTQTVVIAYEDTAFPTSVADGAQYWAAEYGFEVLGIETYPLNIADVSGIMAKFKELEPDVFIGGGYFNDAVLFIRAAKEMDFNPKAMVITVSPSNPKLVQELGADAEYVIGPTQWEASMSYADDYFGTAAEYAMRYETMWNEPPTYQAAESTATALALHLAIEAAGALDTDTVREALRNLDVVTVYGPIQFDAKGRNARKPMGAIQIQDSEILVVAPAEASGAELRYPAPAWSDR